MQPEPCSDRRACIIVQETKRGTVVIQEPPAELNFAAHVIGLNDGRPDKPAYIDERGGLSYGQLADAIRRCAAGYRAAGLQPEQRLFLLMHDGIDWPVAFLGALYAGIVPVAVNTLLSTADYAYMIDHSGAAALLVSAPLLPVIDAALGQARCRPAVIVAGAVVDGRTPFSRLFEAGTAAAAPTRADDIAFWLYSSGSTGRPKGTVHSHGNLFATNATYGVHVLGLTDQDVVFSAAKLFFAYGLGNALTFPLSAGATTVLMGERPTPASVFARLTRHRPSVFFGVPTLYAAMLAAPGIERSDVALRLAVSAGEALPRDIGERFEARFGCPIMDGIGSTEMLHIFLSNRVGDIRYGTTGTPVPGYDVELRSDDGRPVGPGTLGDLYVRGPSAALLYWADRGRSRATFLGPWTRSGDKYLCDENGYYVYAGRSDDMLKVSGQYVSPFEVEGTLVEHPAVLEAAVIGTADASGLTKTKAFLVLKPEALPSTALEDEIRAFVKARLAAHKYPRAIEFVDELPKTATGKIQRFKLRQREAAA